MKMKKVPLRTCVVTKEKLEKKDLIRVVKNKENQVFVDETLNSNKDYNFYKQFFVTDEAFDFYNSIEYGKYIPNN